MKKLKKLKFHKKINKIYKKKFICMYIKLTKKNFLM